MFRRRHNRADARVLRAAVERLPRMTREAMLEGIAQERIVAGAYSDPRGGVCPMLAAHRRGPRTSGVDFARVWDRFTGVRGGPAAATPAQLQALRALLEESLAPEPAPAGAAWLRPVCRYDDLRSALSAAGLGAELAAFDLNDTTPVQSAAQTGVTR